jgi:hypothetical protein
MTKKLLFFALGACFLFLIISGLRGVYSVEGPVKEQKAVESKPAGPAVKTDNKIAIAHTEIFGELERPQVIFDHQKHIEALKKEGKKEAETCTTCHPVDKEKDLIIFNFPKKVKGKDKDSVMHAYHDECIGCHKEKRLEKKKAGPVVCADCHLDKLRDAKPDHPAFEFDFKVHDTHDKKLKEKNIKEPCDLCHHIYNGELVYERGKEWSCYYCHDLTKKTGPVLAAATRITKKKDFTIRKVSHIRCLNCHLYFTLREKPDPSGKKKAGPIVCNKCHTGKYLTVAELEKVPRPDAGQPEKPFLNVKNARLKGVMLDHKTHEMNSKTCRACHHETLTACKECHDLMGNSNGGWVNNTGAYHDISSGKSCVGCHGTKQKEKDCAGCHHAILPMNLETNGPKKDTCARCHTGKKEGIPTPKKLSLAEVAKELEKEKVKKELEIKVLEKEFKPVKLPHYKMLEKLVKISNDSKMGTYFHAKIQTICEGCHHQSRAEVEAKKNTPPLCRNCHSITFDPVHMNRPRLLAAYHRQCISCHEEMKLKKPKECKECHEEKTLRPKYVIPKPSGYDDLVK